MEDILEWLKSRKPEIDQQIEKIVPRKIDKDFSEWAFGKPRFSFDLESINKSISDPIWDLMDRGGKRWRPALFLLITEMLDGDPDKVRPFSALLETIHAGTLCVDDVEDLGELRRGKPCTHKTFGMDVAINTGNYMYFIPLLLLTKNKGNFDDKTLLRAYGAYSQEMINVSIGQALDIWWHKGKKLDVTEEQYLQMCAFKTGTLSRLSARLAAILSGADEETEFLLSRLSESLGVGFQIQDDVLSASEGEFAKKKGFGDDITEGKRSLMVIHALKNAPDNEKQELIDILGKHTRDHDLLTRAIRILNKNGSVDYAREFSKKIISDAWKEVEPKLPDNPARKTLESFMDFAISRQI